MRPFSYIEVTHVPHGNYKLHCYVCGADWGDWSGKVTAKYLFDQMAKHVESLHKTLKELFEVEVTLL